MCCAVSTRPEPRTDTASTSWCPLCAAARARFRQPTQRSNRATQYHVLHCIRLNLSLQGAGLRFVDGLRLAGLAEVRTRGDPDPMSGRRQLDRR